MATPPSEEIVTLVAAQAAARVRLAEATAAGVRAQVGAFADWYSDAAVAVFAQRLARLTQGGARNTAAITDAYLARVASLMAGRRIGPVGVVDTSALRQGVDPDRVYARLAAQYRYLASLDLGADEALQRVTERAGVMADMDTQLAHRDQAARFVDETGADAWRRIIRPELSEGGACGLCVVAADRLYYREDLKAVHERCKCEVLPVYGEADPGLSLNRQDLDALYDAAGSNRGADLKRVRIAVETHGELGQVLRDADQHFRGPGQVAA